MKPINTYKLFIMKWNVLIIVFILLGCSKQNEKLSASEIDQIRNTIIERTNKLAQDLENLNYQEIMTFYADIDDHIVFGDGYYWGDYKTVDGIWHDVCEGFEKGATFEFDNHKVHVFSKDIASCLVEFFSESIEANGDTAIAHGCYSFGM